MSTTESKEQDEDSSQLLLLEQLEQLQDLVEKQDFAQVVELCESETQALLNKAVKNDKQLQLVVYKVYAKALLQEEAYTKLLLEVKAPNNVPAVRQLLEPLQRYAAYRLGNTATTSTSTTSTSTTSSEDSIISQHVQAQSLYHRGETQAALDCYQALLLLHEDDEELQVEVLNNVLAVLTSNATPYAAAAAAAAAGNKNIQLVSQDEWIQRVQDSLKKNKSACNTEDVWFNYGTWLGLHAHIASERHAARQHLSQALKLCNDDDDDDDDDDADDDTEAQVIRLQLDWMSLFWGDDHPTQSTGGKPKAQHNPRNALLAHLNPLLMALSTTATNKPSPLLVAFLEKALTEDVYTSKWTPLQRRLLQYNLALVYYHHYIGSSPQEQKQDYAVKCRQQLDQLASSLVVSKKTNSKKKAAVMIPTPSKLDTLWWQVRIQVLQAYLIQSQSSSAATNDNDNDKDKQQQDKEWNHIWQQLQEKRDKLMQYSSSNDNDNDNDDSPLRDHILVYLELHLHHLQHKRQPKDPAREEEEILKVLQKQQQIRNFPAVTASLAQLYSQTRQPDKAQAVLLEQPGAEALVAEMAVAQGEYSKAVELYQTMLQQQDQDKHNPVLQAKWIQALSQMDPDKACQQWKEMDMDRLCPEDDDQDEEEESLDGQALEQQELPRLTSRAGGPSSTATTTMTSLVGLDAATTNINKKNKKSRASILRRREKQRQAYLKSLQQQGKYMPSKPTVPDPERWIPKMERQRRRRRNNASNKASQGSGVSAKDAAQLDVAARQAAGQAEIKSHSTAHMSAVGGGGKGGGKRR